MNIHFKYFVLYIRPFQDRISGNKNIYLQNSIFYYKVHTLNVIKLMLKGDLLDLI